ncbi:MAG: GlmU family protein [Ignavibacteria bacterium]|jgi:UDP-N-acetylglucosamine diphosphorylase/glucosamine-1-phosphate N-acetyltransferase
MHLCIFEDKKYSDFFPLTYSRPVYDLVCGGTRLREKIIREFPDRKYSLHCRKYLEDIVKNQNPGIEVNTVNSNSCLFINGRINPSTGFGKLFSEEDDDCIYKTGKVIAAVKLSGSALESFEKQLNDILDFILIQNLPTKNIDVKLYNYLWEMISDNGAELVRDIEYLRKKGTFNIHPEEYVGVQFVNPDKIYIRQNVTIKPGVVIDATDGPVYIDEDAFIYPNAVIEGPVFIGKDTKIKSGATIYENVSIGEVCKVGGEVEESIFLSYSNKQHAGFIGHSYLGSWVNLGADTNCSDLKNNYSKIKITLGGKSIDTGVQFLGVIMGDHSKTAINTMFNTGTVVGFSSNIFGAGFPPKYIPSFSWGGSEGLTSYDLSKGIDTAQVVTGRRSIKFSPEDKKLFESIFKMTSEERIND